MAGDRLLSGFRKPPQVEETDEEDRLLIATQGALAWMRSSDRLNWDKIAEKAVELALTGKKMSTIALLLDVSEEELKRNVDVERIKAFVDSMVATTIYKSALGGNEKMLTLVAKSQLGWGETKTLEVNGTINVRPVLNMSLLTKEEAERIAKGLPEIDVTPDGK